MKLPNIWFGWILIVGLIVISGVSAAPGDICTTQSQCEAGEYCHEVGFCGLCYDNNVCAIYGNSIDGDCSKCGTQSFYGTFNSSGNILPPPPSPSSTATLTGLFGLIFASMVAFVLV